MMCLNFALVVGLTGREILLCAVGYISDNALAWNELLFDVVKS